MGADVNRCCDLHGTVCEPGDLCCNGCSEAGHHTGHTDGTPCVLHPPPPAVPVIAELVGGPSDGQTMHIERPYRVITAVDPVRAEALDITAEGPHDLTHTLSNYRLVWDAQTGGPARTAEGHYRYRYGPHEPLYPDLPLWMLSEFPQAYAWEHVGPGHWRGKQALRRNDFGDVLHWGWLYVGYHERGDGAVVFIGRVATQEVAAQINADLARLMWTEIDRAIAHELLPECVVPQCAVKGSIVLTATESGRFASRDWQPGEEIRLCPPHSLDVHRAAFTPYRELPEWLRVDARPEPDPLEEPDERTEPGDG